MNCQVQITLRRSDLGPDEWRNIASWCGAILEAFGTKLNLSSLSSLVITDDLKTDVTAFQRRVGAVVEISDNPEYPCVAKTVHYSDPVKGRCATILIEQGVLLGLMDKDSRPSDGGDGVKLAPHSLSFSILAHELGHVHDDFYVEKRFGELGALPPLGGPPGEIASRTGRLIWSEYHAERIASGFAPALCFKTNLETLVTIYNKMVVSVTKAHAEFRVNQDMPSLWSTVVEMTGQALNQLGRLAPYLNDLSPETRDRVAHNIGLFDGLMLDLQEELERLFPDFNKWEFWAWDNLNDFVWEAWALCGVKPRNWNEAGLYVDVPGLPTELREVSREFLDHLDDYRLPWGES